MQSTGHSSTQARSSTSTQGWPITYVIPNSIALATELSSFHHVVSEKQEFEVEPVGDHEYLVRVHGTDEDAETWVRVTPEVLDGLGIDGSTRPCGPPTVAFLLRHQDAADFPAIVEIEDVLASYPDYRSALTG